MFSGLKRKHALKDLNTYKELIRLCIRELINDNESLYCPWLNVCSATILIFYPWENDVNTHTIVPEKGKILTYAVVSFVSGHYD